MNANEVIDFCADILGSGWTDLEFYLVAPVMEAYASYVAQEVSEEQLKRKLTMIMESFDAENEE